MRRHCEARGMICLAERWRSPAGEIDLILRDGAEYVFLEVKASRTFDAALERITARQVARVHRAAAIFLETRPEGPFAEARYDAGLVDAQGRVQVMEHALVAY
ncbi:YraN family protein [Primorskyibacter sp. S187A]|uniref:YraN family protein n=1 Tax=Primorskyibacter sp. S187A TaxID=3415130 RepID=UPI003C7CFBE8